MGDYQLPCNSCNLSYVGQTSRSLKVVYKEHMRYIRYTNPKSAYAQHTLRNQHEYGTMNNVMTLFKSLNNPNMLTPMNSFTSKLFTRKGSSFLHNTQATRILYISHPTRMRSPDRPARSQLLYQLSYPAHNEVLYKHEYLGCCTHIGMKNSNRHE